MGYTNKSFNYSYMYSTCMSTKTNTIFDMNICHVSIMQCNSVPRLQKDDKPSLWVNL